VRFDLKGLNDWLQLVASVGVILGLGLVAYELRQQHNLARAEMGSDMFSAFQSWNQSAQSESILRVTVKAADRPDELTSEEHLLLDMYYWNTVIVFPIREAYMQRRGVFGNEMTEDDLANMAQIAGSIILATPYGEAWYEVNRSEMYPHIRSVLDVVRSDRTERSALDKIVLIENKLSGSDTAPTPSN
jgi:hypothetical protein